MKFTLTLSLDNAEAEEYGIDQVLPEYLMQVARRCQDGHADAGTVRDGNGNTIGQYRTSDD